MEHICLVHVFHIIWNLSHLASLLAFDSVQLWLVSNLMNLNSDLHTVLRGIFVMAELRDQVCDQRSLYFCHIFHGTIGNSHKKGRQM